MGADIHITVGRIHTKRITEDQKEESAGTELALFNNRRVQFGDIELSSEIPREVDLYRNYSLFGFLASVRGSIKPIMQLDELMNATNMFIDWLNKEHRRIEGKEAIDTGWWGRDDGRDLIGDYATYDIGEHSRVFYPVAVLVGFNYDEVALVETKESTRNNPRYERDPDGDTYRTHCGEQYFKFLEWCVLNGWQFVIFGFDN